MDTLFKIIMSYLYEKGLRKWKYISKYKIIFKKYYYLKLMTMSNGLN